MSTPEIAEIFSYIEKIRQKLWCGREIGQAAVMVGAGFSRNAERASETAKPFPLWSDLVDTMKGEIYYSGPGGSENALKKAPNDALKLATQYECMFDRHALDDLIVKSIPDHFYNPGSIHEQLLSLPWADVFTTNYDTLLERAARQTYGRKYEVVTTASDIARQMRPRIVKLHGTFPAPPFIITEEDFRTYPSEFAPFVNLVQQAIMESALCMIGFSGEDPNFLHWSGWVRDNLGDNAPPIYLCGVLDLHPSAKKVLASRNIVPVDLGIIFTSSKYPISGDRHRLATEWFILSLLNGEKPGLKNWPNPSKGKNWTTSSRFETAPLAKVEPIPPTGPISIGSVNGPSQATQVINIRDNWRLSRLRYPGWLILPYSNRKVLWDHTKHWIIPIKTLLGEIGSPDDLSLLFELAWRMDKSLMPLDGELFTLISRAVARYDPYPGVSQVEGAAYSPDKPACKEWNWSDIGEMWMELQFYLLKFSREELDKSKFDSLVESISPFIALNPQWKANLYYERGLYALAIVDEHAVREILELWPTTTSSSQNELRRASLYAEIGENERAESIVVSALNSVRSQIEPFSPNFKLLSLEGWLMMLLKALRNTGFWATEQEDYKDRWEDLAVFKCNPWDDINALKADLQTVRPQVHELESISPEFDLNRQSISRRFGGGSEYDRLIAPLNMIRVFSEAGLPLKLTNVRFFSDLVINSAKLVSEHYPLRSISTIIRTGDKNGITSWFSRANVAILSPEQAGMLADICMRQLEDGIRRLGRRNYG